VNSLWNGKWDGWTDLVAILIITFAIAVVRIWLERRRP
jgi:hypothetical protein